MKKIVSIILSFVFLLTMVIPAVYGKTDDYIFSDPVINRYLGRAEAAQLIQNLSFSDMPADISSRDAIVRSGVLNLIKAYAPTYNPAGILDKQEAIAIALRAAGFEDQAQTVGTALLASLPPDSPLQEVWSIGYLNLARTIGLITLTDYNDALVADQSALDPAVNFVRADPATREEFADWLAKTLIYADANVFAPAANQQSIYGYRDWTTIAPRRVNSVEQLSRYKIMTDNGTGQFRPKAPITRMEAANALRAMDQIYYRLIGLTKKTGTVGGLADAQQTQTNSGQIFRDIYVRGADGKIDVLRFSQRGSTSPQDGTTDAVTLKNSTVSGLGALEEGDQIEYLVNPADNTVVYVLVTGGLNTRSAQGLLKAVDIAGGTITLTDDTEKTFTFPMAAGLYGTDTNGGYMMFNNEKRSVTKLPIGSALGITLVNNIVTALRYIGEPVVRPETWGIVTDNNPALGYITLIGSNGLEITKNYNPANLRVQKTEHYDMRDTIGSIHSLFPDLYYNPRETDMSALEPGDIVSFRTDPDDNDIIISISASTNYTTRYGRIREFRTFGDMSNMLIEYENGQTAWFTVADDIMITKAGRPVNAADVQPGDWARLLINQALIAPGYMMESVKEIQVEGDAHLINTIVQGKLTALNTLQNTINIQDAQTLTATGWSNYKQIAQYSLAGKQIEYFYEDKPVTLSYVANYLKRSNASVYIALENNYAGETIRKVTFRTGRDEFLSGDTILSTDGSGGFSVLSNIGSILTDPGTIVRRNGRLVDGRQIIAPDYAMVSLNGANKAAIVDIVQAPDTSGIMIARGRIYSVDEGKSFKVQSMSLFNGQSWNYTPIEREFSIDYNTLFFDNTGLIASDTFIGYTTESVLDRVYNIVIDGSRAARVIDAPYAAKSVRGTIYRIEGNTVSLKDMSYYDAATGKWSPISNRDASGTVTVGANTIIADRNAVVGLNSLKVGNQLKIMTDTLPARITSGLSVNGYIVLVER